MENFFEKNVFYVPSTDATTAQSKNSKSLVVILQITPTRWLYGSYSFTPNALFHVTTLTWCILALINKRISQS